jgi:protein CpxP
MKARRIQILAVTAAVVLAVAAALAQGMHHRGGPMGGDFPFGGQMLGYFSDVLDLTQAQQDQVKAIMEKEKSAIHPLMQQMMQAHKDINKLAESGTFDETKVRALAAQQSQNMTELIVQKARIQAELMQVLTADQKTKLQQLRAKHEARMKEHMAEHAPPSD